jgi:hypothetical protein
MPPKDENTKETEETKAEKLKEQERRLAHACYVEEKVTKILNKVGWSVMSVGYIPKTGYGAPLLSLAHNMGRLVLPDLLCFNGEELIWLEVKYRTAISWHENTNTPNVAFETRLLHQYLRIQEHTKIPVFVLFWVKEEREMRVGSITFLANNFHHEHPGALNKMMTFWDWNRLKFYREAPDEMKET